MLAKDESQTAGPWERLPVGKKLVMAFALLLGLFVGATACAFYFARDLDSARDWTQHTFEVLVTVGDLRTGMLNQETGLRGYVISGDDAFLAPYEIGNKSFQRALRQATRLTSDNAAQQERLARVAALETRWQREIFDTVENFIQSDNKQAAQSLISSGQGERLLSELRAAFEQLSLAELQLLAEREARFARSRQVAIISMLALLTVGLLIGLLAIVGVSRQVTTPLSRLAADMRSVTDGDLHIQVPHRQRRDEVGAIARALEHFRTVSITSDATAWVRQKVGELRLAAQEASTEEALCRDLLIRLAPMVNARFAALYVFNDVSGRFELQAGYGVENESRIRDGFAEGEGLAGQCARQQEQIVIADLPEDYLKVTSGLGAAQPTSLVLAPAVYAGEVLAVLELALFSHFRDRYKALIADILPTTALSLATLKRHRQTQELLEETHAQAEQLQASENQLRNQQEKLRHTNQELREQSDELSKQSEELRASEEELKVQAEELQATNEELRQKSDVLNKQKSALEQASAELEERAEALAQASQYKSEFLANMSHELRTPLNSLLILARSLADNDNGHLDEEEVEAATIVHESGSNLLSLINDILDLSKVEAGKLHAHFESMNLAALRDRLTRNFEHVASKKGLAYRVELDPAAPATLRTDAGKLEQIINNLLANALKFTKQGGVRVTLGPPPVDIKPRSPGLTASNCLSIAVKDDGIGIPENKRERIFQAFEQVDASTSRVYGGTGLGLSISQRLAHLLGGEVHLQSVSGQGSTFTVLIPFEPPEQTSAEVSIGKNTLESTPEPIPQVHQKAAIAVSVIPDDREEISGEDRSILIVEDDPVFAKVLRDDARNKGFKCLVAGDGETGLELARAHRPTGILLDIGLPGIDGWTVLEQLKAQPSTRAIPVHILSAGDDTGQGQASGAVGYLPKPVTREGLEAVFSRVLEAAGSHRKRLLVVDDDDAARAAVKALLRDDDMDIDYAGSGDAALKMLAQHSFDCVVLDLNLPDISGFDLLERIDNNEHAPPVIVYSGRELTDSENVRLRAHTDSIVIKGSHSSTRLHDEITLFMHSIRNGPKASDRGPRPGDTDLDGKTALLVDDDMRNTFALSRVLRGKGMKVLMAQDGFKALEQLERQPDVDIVLMDIMMPELDGYETMRRIRAQPRFKTLPMLALTAKAMKGDREQCIAAGANDYLSKPIDTEKLLSMMRAWA